MCIHVSTCDASLLILMYIPVCIHIKLVNIYMYLCYKNN